MQTGALPERGLRSALAMLFDSGKQCGGGLRSEREPPHDSPPRLLASSGRWQRASHCITKVREAFSFFLIVVNTVDPLAEVLRTRFSGIQLGELCCGAAWAVKAVSIKQQHSSAVVLLEVLSALASCQWELSALVGASVQGSYRTRTRQSGCNMLLEWCRRNVADSSTIYNVY